MIRPVNRIGNMEKEDRDIGHISDVVSLTFINSMIRKTVPAGKARTVSAPRVVIIQGYI
ncbi:MAG: hypothetical protein ACMUIG_00595 [Thermoplasmatota archaeon]